MSGDTEQDYFADGIVDELITALSRFKTFAVVSRTSTFAYKHKAVDIREAARELGVRYLLEGSVRRAGQRLRVTALSGEQERAKDKLARLRRIAPQWSTAVLLKGPQGKGWARLRQGLRLAVGADS